MSKPQDSIQVKLIDYKLEKGDTNNGVVEQDRHVFTFMNEGVGLVPVTIKSIDYLERVQQVYEVETLEQLITLFKNRFVTLYMNVSENFVGFALLPGFKVNQFPHQVGQNVKITGVEASNERICIELEDGTVANRSFSTKNGEDYYPDIQKRLRFIRSLNIQNGDVRDYANFDFNELIGGTVTYNIDSFAKNQFWSPKETYLPEKGVSDGEEVKLF